MSGCTPNISIYIVKLFCCYSIKYEYYVEGCQSATPHNMVLDLTGRLRRRKSKRQKLHLGYHFQTNTSRTHFSPFVSCFTPGNPYFPETKSHNPRSTQLKLRQSSSFRHPYFNNLSDRLEAWRKAKDLAKAAPYLTSNLRLQKERITVSGANKLQYLHLEAKLTHFVVSRLSTDKAYRRIFHIKVITFGSRILCQMSRAYARLHLGGWI